MFHGSQPCFTLRLLGTGAPVKHETCRSIKRMGSRASGVPGSGRCRRICGQSPDHGGQPEQERLFS